jgi:6-phosphogluconolactonase
MNMPHMHTFATLEAASTGLADWVASHIARVLVIKPRVVVALPGGSTPEHFLGQLASMPLDWSRITLMPTDERCVPTGHPRSNEAMLRRVFGPLQAGRCNFVSFHAEGADHTKAADVASARVLESGLPDIVVSGMGDDGHIASLFPDDPSWNSMISSKASPAVLATYPDGLEPRLSLAPQAISCAKLRALLIAGPSKQAVLLNSLQNSSKNPSDCAKFPVLLLAGTDSMFHVFGA